jgi:hypothetical protein
MLSYVLWVDREELPDIGPYWFCSQECRSAYGDFIKGIQEGPLLRFGKVVSTRDDAQEATCRNFCDWCSALMEETA